MDAAMNWLQKHREGFEIVAGLVMLTAFLTIVVGGIVVMAHFVIRFW